MATIADLEQRMDKMMSVMEKASKPRSAAGVAPSQLFGGFEDTTRTGNQWPVEQLQRIAKSYSPEMVDYLLPRTKGGKPRGLGWGPALVKMAQIALGPTGGYNQENLEKEFGFVPWHKATEHGVKQLTGEVRKVALAEGSGITGGYVVPPQFMTELLTIAGEDAFIEPRAKVVPMTTRTFTWPMLDITTAPAAGTSPYFGGILATWQPEAATISETEPQFKQSEWTAYDLVLYTVSSNQLLQDNGIGLDALLTQLFGQAITWYKEYAFLRGAGTGSLMPLGILNAPATYVQARGASSTFKLVDAAAMMSRLHVKSWDSACWIMHQSVLPQLILMHDYTGSSNVGNRLVWLNPAPQGDGGPASMKLPQAFLNGLPVYFTEKVPTLGTKGDVMLCDLSMYVIGNRLDMQIDVSKDFLFRTNQLAWRVVIRCDGKPWLNNVVTDSNGWVSSPFVALNT